ncbi:hypothetical protein [Desulfosporosinus nitroreducens]|uniref:hypothetical protein n=1 Tax=Desulfosporosinus nitroreducens TaxID=2018668 RepID=UPI00207C433A|nr:hypothetical protein [Desulfosporosinus nitroreducens]MCO1604611.1 hypothetical protein [Desulfosporosinus nitroreducens]
MQRYLLYPPFLTVHEETDFSDIWESFCLKLLKLEYGTNEIERRRPPESGIDLFYRSGQIAYQCKSTLNDNKFNIKIACNSLRSALPLKNTLPWALYTICSNNNLTGNQITALQSVDPHVNTRGKDSWIELCRRFPDQVKANFRTLCDVPENRIHNDFQLLINGELDMIRKKLSFKPINVLIYHHGHDQIYNFVLSKTLTISDLILITRRLFNLHETTKDYKGEVQPKPFFKINDTRYDEEQRHDITLEELGIDEHSTLLFGLDIVFPGGQLTRTVMHANNNSNIHQLSETEIVASIFRRFDASLDE